MTEYLLTRQIDNTSSYIVANKLKIHRGLHTLTNNPEKALRVTQEEADVLTKFFPELKIKPSCYHLKNEFCNSYIYCDNDTETSACRIGWTEDLTKAYSFDSLEEAAEFRQVLTDIKFSKYRNICIERH